MTTYSKFYFETESDESVGILPKRFEMAGDFCFEDAEQEREFREAMQVAFEILEGHRVLIQNEVEYNNEDVKTPLNERDSIVERFAGYLVARHYNLNNVYDYNVDEESVSCNIDSKRVHHSHFTNIYTRDMTGGSFRVRLSFDDFDNILVTGNYFPPNRRTQIQSQ